MAITGIALLVLRQRTANFLGDLSVDFSDLPAVLRSDFRKHLVEEPAFVKVWLLACLVIGAVVRVRYMNAPLQYDEAEWAFLAEQPFFVSLTTQRIALHNLPIAAIGISIRIFGTEPWAIRLPTSIAGLALIPALYLAAQSLFDRWTAITATAVVSVSWPLVAFSVIGRGYAFGNLFFVMMLVLVPSIVHQANRGAMAAFGVFSALAIYSVQSMVFAHVSGLIFMIALAIAHKRIAWNRHGARQIATMLGIPSIVCGIFVLVFFSPLLLAHGINGLATTTDHISGHTGFTVAAAHVIDTVYDQWGLDVPVFSKVLFLGACLAGMTLNRRAALLMVATAIGISFGLLLIGSKLPSPRIWQFALPVFAMAAGAGVSAVLSLARHVKLPSIAEALTGALIALSLAGTGWSELSGDTIIRKVEGRLMPIHIEAARKLAAYLQNGDLLAETSLGGPAFQYYLARELREKNQRLKFEQGSRVWLVCDISAACLPIPRSLRLFVETRNPGWPKAVSTAEVILDERVKHDPAAFGVPLPLPESPLAPILKFDLVPDFGQR